MTEEETWRDVVGYEGLYLISSLGRVKSIARIVQRSDGQTRPVPERILQTRPDATGYPRVSLGRNGSTEYHRVHVLVCLAFYGPRPNGLEAAHENGVRTDNRVSNLSWKTTAEQAQDKLRHGTTNPGTQNPNAKLSTEAAEDLRALSKSLSRKELSTLFGLSEGSISEILNHKRYK